jgi:hypothetical protein
MAKAPRLTRGTRPLLKPETKVRRVTFAERLANPARFSLRGEYYVAESVKKVTSRTPFVTVSRRKDAIAGVSHTKASAERAAGERGYKTAASEEQAAATRKTWVAKRALAETRAGTVIHVEKRIRKGPRKGEPYHARELVSAESKDNYFRLRRQKLAGKWIEDGEWHEMMTVARAINDPMLSALSKS